MSSFPIRRATTSSHVTSGAITPAAAPSLVPIAVASEPAARLDDRSFRSSQLERSSEYGSGEHKIYFQVIPVLADANNNWAARLEIWLVGARGNEANVFVYDVDNQRFPKQRLGDPLPPIVSTLIIRTASESQK